jgi:hypothetical protein
LARALACSIPCGHHVVGVTHARDRTEPSAIPVTPRRC